MIYLETTVKTIKELQDEITSLRKYLDEHDLNGEIRDDLITAISVKMIKKEELVDEINSALAVAGLTTRRLR